MCLYFFDSKAIFLSFPYKSFFDQFCKKTYDYRTRLLSTLLKPDQKGKRYMKKDFFSGSVGVLKIG